jgi:hypothetical protein
VDVEFAASPLGSIPPTVKLPLLLPIGIVSVFFTYLTNNLFKFRYI